MPVKKIMMFIMPDLKVWTDEETNEKDIYILFCFEHFFHYLSCKWCSMTSSACWPY